MVTIRVPSEWSGMVISGMTMVTIKVPSKWAGTFSSLVQNPLLKFVLSLN